MIINAENLVLGRMATTAAKKALEGENVVVVNCEKAIIKSPDFAKKRYLELMDIGQPQQGPYIKRRPDMFVKRVIRGMLPYKKGRGRSALDRVKCYIGVPQDMASEKLETVENAVFKPSGAKSTTVGRLCESLGAK